MDFRTFGRALFSGYVYCLGFGVCVRSFTHEVLNLHVRPKSSQPDTHNSSCYTLYPTNPRPLDKTTLQKWQEWLQTVASVARTN